MVVRTGTNDQSHYLFKQKGKSVLSIQGLIIMFMFGVAVTLTISVVWLMYAEYRIEREEIRRANKEKLSKDFMEKFFKLNGDDDEGKS
jgi:hypothetical protein